MSQDRLYFQLTEQNHTASRLRIVGEQSDLSAVLMEAVHLLELAEGFKGAPGQLERSRSQLHHMLRGLNNLGYRLQQCRGWEEVAALLNVPVVRRKGERQPATQGGDQ